MKKIRIILLSLLLYSIGGYAQQIIGREYFIDTDPGTGNGTAHTFSASDSVTETITLPTVGLSKGFHRIYTRYHYNNSSWGIAEDRLFFIYDTTHPLYTISPNVSSGEYFVDTDPGIGHGTSAPAFASGDSVQQTISLPTTGLGVGFHRMYTRYRDLSGNWGIAEGRLFYIFDTTSPVLVVQPAIVAGEYFIDNEPGPGHGTAISVSPSADSVQQTLNISTASLALGVHYIYIRYRDANGKWGIAEPVKFQVCNPPPAAITATGDSTFCAGGSVRLQANTGHKLSYQWENNSIAITRDTGSVLTVHDTSGQYTVIVTDSTGCNAVSNAITITVNQPTLDSISQVICQSGSYLFNGTELTMPGVYRDTVPTVGCDSITVLTLSTSVCTGVEPVSIYSIGLYPNPAGDEVILKGGALAAAKPTLTLRDITGKIINIGYEAVDGDKIKLHTAPLAPGLYFVTLRLNGEDVSLRFVKN